MKNLIEGMMITIQVGNDSYQVNTDFALSLAIPVEFQQLDKNINDVKQPNHFNANLASRSPMQGGGFIGDTEQDGSCNVNELIINPHCNGTHTETIAHICDASAQLSLKISDISVVPLMPCVVISVKPEQVKNTIQGDSYTPQLMENDKIISRLMLTEALADYKNNQLQSLVVRTFPNSESKKYQIYNQNNQPAFFTRDAILYLNEKGIEHLLVDLPSLDRLHDDGLLTCHHLFWQVIEGSHQASPNSLLHKTITEMAFIDEQICDGFYFLNLQTPAFINDAAPSRPILYDAIKITTREIHEH